VDKDQVRKEFNEWLDSASEETVRDFMKFMKERRDKKLRQENRFNNRAN